MRLATGALAVVGALATLVFSGLATAFVRLGAPFTVNSVEGYRLTALGATPGVALSVVAVGLAVTAAAHAGRRGWIVALILWPAVCGGRRVRRALVQ